ncbi:ABC transporter permease [Methyloligella sp. 2.7D]|uniref:ABC transporter permease n=1 Tax=unclassified Methyloligella TaxID=2625955 RepID=UPI00157BD37C|nr:ABC transporter permease [Methyloligella sp. GL2]QKP78095.1 ABC transporter permease [Methyloligella sp. GL2]
MTDLTADTYLPSEGESGLKRAKRIDRRRMLFWVLPPTLWFFVFMIIPYGMLFYYSLGSVDYVTFTPGLSPANFIKVFTTEPYLGVMLLSAKLGLFTAIFSAIIGYPLAFYLAFHAPETVKRFVYLLVIVPWWASYLVKAYAWKTILGTGGILNTMLIGAGIIDEPLTIFLYNQFSVTLTLVYIFTPFAVLSIYAQLERIPTSLIDAALNAGATRWEVFRKVVFPLSIPGILAGAVITFSLGFGDFVAPVLVGGPSSLMISNIVINLLGVAFDWPMAAAIGLVVITLGLALISVAHYLEHRFQHRL